MADIHKPWSHEFRPGAWAHYTGSSHPRDISQLDPKSAVLIHDDVSITRPALPFRPIRVWDPVLTSAEVAPIQAWLQATAPVAGLEPVAWIAYGPDAAAAVQALSLIPGKLICAEPAELSGPRTTQNQADLTILNPLEALARLVDPDEDPDVFAFASTFLTKGREPSDILAEWRDRTLAATTPKDSPK